MRFRIYFRRGRLRRVFNRFEILVVPIVIGLLVGLIASPTDKTTDQGKEDLTRIYTRDFHDQASIQGGCSSGGGAGIVSGAGFYSGQKAEPNVSRLAENAEK